MRRILALLATLGVALTTVALVVHDAPVAAQNGAGSEEVDQGPAGPGLARHPLFIEIRGHDARGNPFITSPSPRGYTPPQVQAYLGLTGDGAGQTVAIVDAYDHPNIVADLNTFSTTYSLPLVCGTAGADPANCLTFTKATPQGQPRTNSGWALEISLDVEWAHAVAPRANILLVEAVSNSGSNLLAAIDYAAQNAATVISNSWGMAEFSGEAASDSHCNLAAAVCTFSSGDNGNPGSYPAYSPYVLAVGGTTLTLTSGGAPVSETAWSGSGGGVSQYEPKPAYQNAVNAYANRGNPDVSYNADPNTGFAVYDSVSYQGQSGWFQLGGTSAGAPQWAAILAAANQGRAAAGLGPLVGAGFQANTRVYQLTGLYDVTSGSNGNCGSICSAGTGYDFVTGLGSPRGGIDTALVAGVPGSTATPTLTPTASPTATSTPQPTATNSATPTATSTLTPAPTSTATTTATRTPLPTATSTPTSTATATASPTATATQTPLPTATATATSTSTPTATSTATATSTPTATATQTLLPTATATPTPTATSTATATSTPTATATQTPPPTATATPTPTATPTATATSTPTATATQTALPAPTFTPTPTGTSTSTATPTATDTASPTDTPTATSTPSATPTPSATATSAVAATTTPMATPTPCGPDSNGDGIPDCWEASYACLSVGAPDASGDPDGDGLTNLQEYLYRTNPCNPDTDGDGYSDGQEVALGKDPLSYCSIMRADVNMDGVVNLLDLALVAARFGQPVPPAPARYDQNADNKINLLDLADQAAVYAQTIAACP